MSKTCTLAGLICSVVFSNQAMADNLPNSESIGIFNPSELIPSAFGSSNPNEVRIYHPKSKKYAIDSASKDSKNLELKYRHFSNTLMRASLCGQRVVVLKEKDSSVLKMATTDRLETGKWLSSDNVDIGARELAVAEDELEKTNSQTNKILNLVKWSPSKEEWTDFVELILNQFDQIHKITNNADPSLTLKIQAIIDRWVKNYNRDVQYRGWIDPAQPPFDATKWYPQPGCSNKYKPEF